MLKDEGGFDAALPETGEQHSEETELRHEKHGPHLRLGEHMYRGSRGEEAKGESKKRQQQKEDPGTNKMRAQQAERGAEGMANTAVRTAGESLVSSKLDGVDLDQVEVKPQQRRHKKDGKKTAKSESQGGPSDEAIVDEGSPSSLESEQRPEDHQCDDERDHGDPNKTPEVQNALTEKVTEPRRRASDVAEEGSWNEKKIQQKKRDNRTMAGHADCFSCVISMESRCGGDEDGDIEAGREPLRSQGIVE
jgi:hypothetical protein